MSVAAACLHAYRRGRTSAEAEAGALLEAEFFALVRAFLAEP